MPYATDFYWSQSMVPVHIDSTISEEQRPYIEQALAEYAQKTGVVFQTGASSNASFIIQTGNLNGYAGWAEWRYNGQREITQFVVTLDLYEGSLWKPGTFAYEIVLHEIGHSFFQHNDHLSVMNDHDGQYVRKITPADVVQLERHYPVRGGTEGGDDLSGGAGVDRMFAHGGDDTVYGQGGDQVIYGNQGVDQVYGNKGDDTLFGGRGCDQLFGGQGADQVYGNKGNDQIYGNKGDDLLFGGQGDDHLFGDRGDDVLYSNKGADTLWGGEGADTFAADEDDHIADFNPSEGDKRR